jgi:hypothetical protein
VKANEETFVLALILAMTLSLDACSGSNSNGTTVECTFDEDNQTADIMLTR